MTRQNNEFDFLWVTKSRAVKVQILIVKERHRVD